MALFGTIDYALRGDTGNLDKALAKGEKGISDYSKKANSAGGGGAGIGGMAALAAGGIGGAVAQLGHQLLDAGKAVADFVASGMEHIDQLARSAATLGITTGALAGLQHGAALAGVGTEELNHGLEKFQKHISEAGQGNAEAIASFNKLGLQAADLKDLPLEQAVAKVGDALRKTGSDADQLQITLALFGKGAAPLKEMLKGGTEGMEAMQESAKALGLAVSGEQAAQVQEAMRGWRAFQQALEGVGRSLGVIIAPVITEITNLMNNFAGQGAAGLSSNIKFFQELALAGYDLGKAAFEIYLQFFTIFPLLKQIGEAVVGNVGSWQEFKLKALAVMFTVQFYAANWKDQLGLTFDKIALSLVSFGNKFSDVFTAIGNAFKVLMDAFKSGDFSGLGGKLKDAFKDAFERPQTELEKRLGDRIADREKRLKGDLDAFIKEKLDKFNEAAKKDVAPGKGDPLGNVSTKPAAMEAGSKEAFSALFGTQSAADKAYGVANKQLDENKKANKLLEQLIRKQTGLGKAKV